MASPISWPRFRSALERHGVVVKPGKGSHFKLRRVVQGVTLVYVIPVHGNKVRPEYVRLTRKNLRLTPGDGVSDDEFGV